MIVRQCPAMRLAGVLSLPLDTLDRCVITSSGLFVRRVHGEVAPSRIGDRAWGGRRHVTAAEVSGIQSSRGAARNPPLKGVEADALPSLEMTAGRSGCQSPTADQSPSVTAVREPPLYAAEEWPERRTTDRGERWPAVQDRFHSGAT